MAGTGRKYEKNVIYEIAMANGAVAGDMMSIVSLAVVYFAIVVCFPFLLFFLFSHSFASSMFLVSRNIKDHVMKIR